MTTCATFEAAADDLALGFSPTPLRDDLVAHASACAACGARLRSLAAVVDSLLELAPAVEPPVGFEARAVAAMRPPASSGAPRRRLFAVAVAAVTLAVVAAGAVAAISSEPAADTTAADVIGRRGANLGRVELVSTPSPKVVVLLEDDRWEGVWVCELEDDDGAWVEVGRWTADHATGGAWATNVDADLLDATRMRITAANGTVLATSDRLD